MRGMSTPTHCVAAWCRECWVRMDPTCLTDAIKLRLRCLCVQYCPLLPLQLRMEKVVLLKHRTIRIQVRLPTLVFLVLALLVDLVLVVLVDLVLVVLEVLVLLLVPGLLLLLVVEAAELLLEVKVPVAFLLILLFLLLVLLALLVVLVPLLLLLPLLLEVLPLLLLFLQLAEVMVRRGPQAVIHLTQQGTLKQEFRRLQRQRLTTPRHPKDRQERHPALDTHEKKKKRKRKKKKRKIMKSSSKVMKHKSNNINSMNTPRKMAKNPRKIKTPFVQMPPQIQATVTAAPRSPTPPPLFCFFLLRVLLLRWWPRESECERAMHRPHTHSSFSLSVCVSPCMDSRPHLTPRGTHNNVPIVYMHAHPCRPVGALFCMTRTAAVLPGCMGGAP
ncbi:hypothetical protein TCDM_11477 [Trypanosoma cruzi Dm28c]|uniref:Uncharacterized protein n=1 Tax=Trypanosoma cruzi Dm28c TaxID=1416333 RepID=V5B9A0_TRYCR|nr:hypothetical protein TCDM_11477 [Trypanosoma cruzi Dm28c]